MLFHKIFVFITRNNRTWNRNCSKMACAYLRHDEGSEQFQVTFNYVNEIFGVDRQFNLSRRLTENVDVFLGRICVNVTKAFEKKKKKQKSENVPVIVAKLYRNGEEVSGDSKCEEVILHIEDLILKILDTEYRIVLNAPWVDALALPSIIMAGFPVYPLKLEISFAQREKSIYSWFKSKRPNAPVNEWQTIGSGYYYTPSNADLGYHLKLSCMPVNGTVQGFPIDAISRNPVEAGPGKCPFEDRHLFTQDVLPSGSFRVVSYNILADLYADSATARNELFPYCAAYAINIDYRKLLLCKELLGYNADILCLQEVDRKVFKHDLLPILSSKGFSGVFQTKGTTVTEGLACIFSNSKFKFLEEKNIHLANELQNNPLFLELWSKIKTNSALSARFLARTTSLLVVVLQCVEDPNKFLIVGNTHLYFYPAADNIRLLQSGMILKYLQEVRSCVEKTHINSKVSVMLCGDFNSTPEFGVYQLMTKQIITEDHNDWNSIPDEAVKNVCLSHPFKFQSACGTPEFTNFTAGFADCLDYIFFETDKLEVSQVVPLPSEEELRQHTALPSVVFPSDHLALVADIKWSC